MDPMTDDAIQQLWAEVEDSRKELQVFRDRMEDSVKEACGANYGKGGTDSARLMNLLHLFLTIYSHQVAAKDPSVMVTTKYRPYRSTARKLQIDLNLMIQELELGSILRTAATHALHGMGIVKLGLRGSGTYSDEYGGFEYGEPFVSNVSLSDWVHDTKAHTCRQFRFMGNRYRVDFEWAKECGLYKEEGLRDLERQGDEGLFERDQGVRGITRWSNDRPEEYRQHVELVDLFLPYERKIVTLPFHRDGRSKLRFLREDEFTGPPHGPYHLLIYDEVPDQIMGLAPVAHMLDMHVLLNDLLLKMRDDAMTRKNVNTYTDAEDGGRLKNARNGEWVRVNPGNTVGMHQSGGVDPQTMGFVVALRDWFSWLGGNLDSMGGLSPQAETLGQEQMIAKSSMAMIKDLQDRTEKFAARILQDLAWYRFEDDIRVRDLEISAEGTQGRYSVVRQFGRDDIKGDRVDYLFDIQPFSMRSLSPAERAASIEQMMASIVMPMIQMGILPAQGTQVDGQALIRILAEHRGVANEIDEILVKSEPVEMPETPDQQGPAPGKPNGKYERISRSGTTRSGQDRATVAEMMSKDKPQGTTS
jgi:hypothetical protein